MTNLFRVNSLYSSHENIFRNNRQSILRGCDAALMVGRNHHTLDCDSPIHTIEVNSSNPNGSRTIDVNTTLNGKYKRMNTTTFIMQLLNESGVYSVDVYFVEQIDGEDNELHFANVFVY